MSSAAARVRPALPKNGIADIPRVRNFRNDRSKPIGFPSRSLADSSLGIRRRPREFLRSARNSRLLFVASQPNRHSASIGGRPWNRTRHGFPRRSYSPLPHLAARRPSMKEFSANQLAAARNPVNRIQRCDRSFFYSAHRRLTVPGDSTCNADHESRPALAYPG